MTIADIQLLYEYDRWANHPIFEVVSGLSDEQFKQDMGGSFPSVRETLVHILGGHWIWLAYWKNPPRTEAEMTALRVRRQEEFNLEYFADVASLKKKWDQVEKSQQAFLMTLTDDSLNQLLPFRARHIKLTFLMQHVANHATYHRGQVAFMLRQLGVKPPATDFHEFMFATREL